jgi:hypothetical protein
VISGFYFASFIEINGGSPMFNFSFHRRLALTVISAAAITLAGCGGTTSTSTDTSSLTVTPALGAAYGATVFVYTVTGLLLGSGTTGADGKANLTLTGYTAGTPIIIRTVLGIGSYYFNEKTGENTTPITNADAVVTLMAVVPAVASGQGVGVTPLTNMAAAFVGVTAATPIPAKTVTSTAAYEGIAKTNLALGLPADTNITEAPVAATKAAPTGGAGTGKLLAEMAKASTTTPAAQAVALAAAVNTSTGTIATGATPTVLTSVNTALVAAATTLSITVVAPVTDPTTSQISTATTAVTSVVKAAVPGAATGASTGTGTGSLGTGG